MTQWFGSAVIAGAFVLAGAVGVAANAQTTPGTGMSTASPCPSPSASNSLVQSTIGSANCATPKPGATPTINPVASSNPGPVASPLTSTNGTSGTNGSPGATGGAMTTPHP